MMEIGILGGTFDPIHNGHLQLAQHAMEQFQLDKIWLMPSPNPPHKVGKKVTDYAMRAEMVELAEAKLHVEDVSLDALKRILRPWLRMKEPPDTVVLGCTHFPLLQEELLQVLPEGTRLVVSGAAFARRSDWLL